MRIVFTHTNTHLFYPFNSLPDEWWWWSSWWPHSIIGSTFSVDMHWCAALRIPCRTPSQMWPPGTHTHTPRKRRAGAELVNCFEGGGLLVFASVRIEVSVATGHVWRFARRARYQRIWCFWECGCVCVCGRGDCRSMRCGAIRCYWLYINRVRVLAQQVHCIGNRTIGNTIAYRVRCS